MKCMKRSGTSILCLPVAVILMAVVLAAASCASRGDASLGVTTPEPSAPTTEVTSADAREPEPDPAETGTPTETAPPGEVALDVDVVAAGLEVPWGLAILPTGDLLVTERPGRLRLVRGGELVDEPVLVIDVSIPPPLFGIDTFGSEGGLLGVLVHPDFVQNRFFYLFYNVQKNGEEVSRIDRYVLATDGASATFDTTIIDDLPAGVHHQGGRMHIGPDGHLYVGVGAWEPELAQDPDNLSGKVLRMDLDGGVPADNPDPTSHVFISGIRNSQGYDWFDDEWLVVVDHGPSGIELNMPELRGLDEINLARAGDNLGWPRIWGCGTAAELVEPLVTFESSVPPTDATFYRGDLIPEWTNSLLITVVGGSQGGGRHLHRVEFAPDDPATIVTRETYLRGEYGRLRTVVEAPDGSLYVMTSNCDNRGFCPPEQDLILRITPAR